MDIEELTRRVQESIGKSPHEERINRLLAAKIIDESGYLHPDFFTDEAIQNDKKNGKPALL